MMRSTAAEYPSKARASILESRNRSAKSIEQLQREVDELEGILAERKEDYEVLASSRSGGASTSVVSSELATLQTQLDECEAEENRLRERNVYLRRELNIMQKAEKKYATDPRVLDKRNEVKAVQLEIEQVEKEIETLRVVKRRRDVGLREIDRGEEQARRVRGQHVEKATELRTAVKTLSDKVRELQKGDVEAHERLALLREQLKLHVTDADVQQLRETIAKQQEELHDLVERETEWKKRKAGARDEDAKQIAKDRRECTRLEKEVVKLQRILTMKDAQLKKSYLAYGRATAGTNTAHASHT